MKILLAKPRGFCAGVNMAITTLDAALERFGVPVYVYHEIVHNTWVVDDFRRKGAVFVDHLEEVPDGATLLFSAHGVAPDIRRSAESRGLRTIDATCPLVNKVHGAVIRFAAEGYQVVLLGHARHDEIVGIMGEAPGIITLIEQIGEIDDLRFEPDEKLAYLTQTTISMHEARSMIDRLRERFPNIIGPPASSICFATQNRQEAVRRLAPEVDLVMVIGSNNSSNSRRLAEIAEEVNVCSYQVDGPNDIACGWFSGNETVLMTAGASAPEHIVRACIDILVARFGATVEERIIREENVRFQLPKELRE